MENRGVRVLARLEVGKVGEVAVVGVAGERVRNSHFILNIPRGLVCLCQSLGCLPWECLLTLLLMVTLAPR